MLSLRQIIVIGVMLMVLFFIFAVIAFEAAEFHERGFVAAGAKMEFAFAWTMRAAGALLAVIAAIHLVRYAASRGGEEQIAPTCVALLGGLLLLGQQHWAVVVVFGVLTIALIVQQLIVRHTSRTESPRSNETPSAAALSPAVTGIQLNEDFRGPTPI